MKAIPTNSHAALQLVTPPGRPAQVGSLARRIRTIRIVRWPSEGPAPDSAANQQSGPSAGTEKGRQTSGGPPAGRKKPSARPQKAQVPKKKARSADKAGRGKPAPQPKTAARPDSKKAQVLALLRRPQGATLQELRKATGWQAHSVRGFLSGAIAKKMGLTVKSAKRHDGDRVYSIRD